MSACTFVSVRCAYDIRIATGCATSLPVRAPRMNHYEDTPSEKQRRSRSRDRREALDAASRSRSRSHDRKSRHRHSHDDRTTASGANEAHRHTHRRRSRSRDRDRDREQRKSKKASKKSKKSSSSRLRYKDNADPSSSSESDGATDDLVFVEKPRASAAVAPPPSMPDVPMQRDSWMTGTDPDGDPVSTLFGGARDDRKSTARTAAQEAERAKAASGEVWLQPDTLCTCTLICLVDRTAAYFCS